MPKGNSADVPKTESDYSYLEGLILFLFCEVERVAFVKVSSSEYILIDILLNWY